MYISTTHCVIKVRNPPSSVCDRVCDKLFCECPFCHCDKVTWAEGNERSMEKFATSDDNMPRYGRAKNCSGYSIFHSAVWGATRSGTHEAKMECTIKNLIYTGFTGVDTVFDRPTLHLLLAMDPKVKKNKKYEEIIKALKQEHGILIVRYGVSIVCGRLFTDMPNERGFTTYGRHSAQLLRSTWYSNQYKRRLVQIEDKVHCVQQPHQ